MEQKSEIVICRTCLNGIEKNEHVSVYMISDILMSFTSLNISENDGLPLNICISCYQQANDAYQFKLLCEQSDKKLQNIYVHNSSNVNTFENGSTNLTSLITDLPNITNIKSDYETKSEEALEISDEIVSFNCESKINENEIKQQISIDKNNKFFTCKFCNRNFTHQAWLLKHETNHKTSITCNVCHKTFITSIKLSKHIYKAHSRKGAHLCQTCGKQFTYPENLVVHQRIHSGIRPYKCKECNKSFTRSTMLKSHIITHTSDKPHKCCICDNKYARKRSLQRHIERKHLNTSNLRPYKCVICDGDFKAKEDLNQHLKIHKEERQHVCKTCGKCFNSSRNLIVHERTHSGDRPFACHICKKSFIQKHVLNSHLKTHSI